MTACVVVAVVSLISVAAASAGGQAASAGCAAPAKWSRAPVPGYIGSEARTYTQECQTTRYDGPRKTARQFGIRSSKWLTICTKVETQTWQPPFRAAGIAGCMRGFQLWDRAY